MIDTATDTVVAPVTVPPGSSPAALGFFITQSLAPVPTLSEWGLIVAALSLLAAGTCRIGAGRRRQRSPSS